MRVRSSLVSHNRFGYSPIIARVPGTWKVSRLAVYVAVNLEHFEFGKGLGGELVPAGGQGRLGRGPDVLNWSWREYGNRVGAFRLLEALDENEIPASVLVNSELASHAPEVVEAHRRRGDEIVGHGATNSERQGDMQEDDERNLIERVTTTLGRPRGWLGPWISQSDVTPDLLQEAGYDYLLDWSHDDEPTYMRTRSGNHILSLPYPQEINDVPAIMVRRASAAEFSNMIIDNLDELLDHVANVPFGPPLVMGIALHPYIVGQPFRLRHLKRALVRVWQAASSKKIWLATAGDIAKAYIDMRPPPSKQGTEI